MQKHLPARLPPAVALRWAERPATWAYPEPVFRVMGSAALEKYNSVMYEQLPDDIRDRHPFHMHDEILGQPEAVERSIQLVVQHGAPVASVVARARRVFVLGSGTSLHAAKAGAWMLRSFSRGK